MDKLAYNIPLVSSNSNVKMEDDDKYRIQQSIISSQNCKMNRMEKTLNLLLERFKDKENDDEDLLALSKIIDSKNSNTSILPDVISIDDEDPNDEMQSPPNLSSSGPESSLPSNLTPSEDASISSGNKVQLHVPSDTLHDPQNDIVPVVEFSSSEWLTSLTLA